MAIQKKRKVLRAPFVVTVAAAASLAGAAALPGCDPTITDGSCPEARPAAGSLCEDEGLLCDYGEDGCGSPIGTRCAEGMWLDLTATCNPPPPPPACPEAMPAAGSACSKPGESCAYTGPPDCPQPTTLTCGDDGAWSVTIAVSCNPPPPPPPEACLEASTAEECAGLGPACQWLVPGCAEETGTPALPAVGCFPSVACKADTECPAGTLCQEVVVNPCGSASSSGATCAACGFYTNVCVPPSAVVVVPGG